MTSKLKTFLLIFFAIIWVQSRGQRKEKEFSADSVFIFKNFKEWGTTAKLWNNHKMLDSTNANKTKISINDLLELKTIVNNTKRKKLYQQKYGGEIFYLIVYFNGYKKKFVSGSGSNIEIFDDLDDMKRWIIKDPIDIDKFSKLIRRNCL